MEEKSQKKGSIKQTESLRIAFASSHHIGVACLDALLASEHQLVHILTQPDRRVGRGQKTQANVIKEWALCNQVPLFQPQSLKTTSDDDINFSDIDLFIVIAYGLIIPKAILEQPRLGCLNIHYSLLPKWRGAAPIARCIEAGEKQTGITFMQMAEGLDTGDILKQFTQTITPEDTTESITSRLSALGAQQLVPLINQLNQGQISPVQQNHHEASYAHKLSKAQAFIEWDKNTAQAVADQVRAFQPWPVCYATIGTQRIRIWSAKAIDDNDAKNTSPGTILSCTKEGLDICCKQGVLRIEQLQLPGKKIVSMRDFAHACKTIFKEGDCFDCSSSSIQ